MIKKILLILGLSTFVLSDPKKKFDTFTQGEIYLMGLMRSQREMDLTNPNLSESPTRTRMKRPSVESIVTNIKYSGSSLCSPESLETWSCKSCLEAASSSDIKNVTYFENKIADTAGYVAVNTALKTILLVFRGAHSPLNDMQFTDSVTVPFKLTPAQVRVNRGALSTMEATSLQFITPVEKLLADPEYNDYSLTLIGHSLGSAIAPLAVIKLQNHFKLPWERFSLYSYGQARVGNSEFAHWFNSHPLTAVRVVNSLDFVTQFPTKASGSHVHHQNLYYVDQHNHTAKFCSSEVLEDSKCYMYPDFTRDNIVNHVLYLGTLLLPEYSC